MIYHDHLVKTTNDQVVFQFLLGIEGSGHHLHQELFRISNLNKILKTYDGLHDDMANLGEMLWCDEDTACRHKGLWSTFSQWEIPPKGKKLINDISNQLRAVSDKILRNRSERKIDGMNSTNEVLVIPINSSFRIMFSYPMRNGVFTLLQYPDLHDLYKACQIAGVACQHIYLSRDPYEVMRSITMNRDFGNPHEKMLAVISMLSVIESQMISNPKYLAACWNIESRIPNQGTKFIAQYLGWNDDEYEEYFSNMYSKSPLTEKEKAIITDNGNLDIYMENLLTAHDRINRKCMDILEAKHDSSFDDLENSDILSISDQEVREKSNAATLFSSNVDKPSTPSPPEKTGLQVTFNFIIGAEGAGHQVHEGLFDGSPLQKALNSYNLTEEIKDIILALYNPNKMSKGIWSAPCGNHVNDGPKGKLLFKSLTRHLRKVAGKVEGKVLDNIKELVIPINALFHLDITYPSNSLSNSSDFPMLFYPSLEILYRACKEARVVCQHVFLSRNPYEILKSLQESTAAQWGQKEATMPVHDDIRGGRVEGFPNKTAHIEHIQLKKTLTTLAIIEIQLESNPQHLAACWNLENGIHDEGAMLIGRWFGLNDKDFKEKFSSIKMNSSMTKDEKRAIRHEGDLSIYMTSLSDANKRINKKCHDILEGNHGSLAKGHLNNTFDSIKTRVDNNKFSVKYFVLLASVFLFIKIVLMKLKRRSPNLIIRMSEYTECLQSYRRNKRYHPLTVQSK